MRRDAELKLQAAFAELHHRRREQAPPFGAMRDRALREADRQPFVKRVPALRLQWAAACVCLVAALCWIARGPAFIPPQASTADSKQRVEQLLTAIEQELELNAALFSPAFPTDILLTQNPADLSP